MESIPATFTPNRLDLLRSILLRNTRTDDSIVFHGHNEIFGMSPAGYSIRLGTHHMATFPLLPQSDFQITLA